MDFSIESLNFRKAMAGGSPLDPSKLHWKSNGWGIDSDDGGRLTFGGRGLTGEQAGLETTMINDGWEIWSIMKPFDYWILDDFWMVMILNPFEFA